MNKKTTGKLFCSFLKQNLLLYVSMAAIFIICAFVFYLTGNNVEVVGYALLLSAVCVCILSGVSFVRYIQKYRRAWQVYQAISIEYKWDSLSYSNAYEELLIRMIEELSEQRVKQTIAHENNQTEMTDYYTLWVHQIKTPIAAMRLMLQEEDSDKNRKLLLELFKIEQYVEMVLQYLRLDSNYTDYQFQSYNVGELVRQAIRKYAPVFISGKTVLEYEEIEQTVITDEKWMVFVIEQILSNALKYTKNGMIRIYIIEDNGIGIAAEDLPRIFEKGYTGYNGRADKKASGIGLYLCKKIVTKLGCEIWAESVLDKGTKMMIRFEEKEG